MVLVNYNPTVAPSGVKWASEQTHTARTLPRCTYLNARVYGSG